VARCLLVLFFVIPYQITLFSRTGVKNISVIFGKPDNRTSWEESFNEAKQKLGKCSNAIIQKELDLCGVFASVFGLFGVLYIISTSIDKYSTS